MINFSLNKIELIGNITKDPELKFAQSGTAIIKFSLATEHSIKKGDEWEKKSTFHNIVAFGNMAEWLSKKSKKGHKVCVIGRQENESVKQEDGSWKNYSSVIAQDIIPFLATNSDKNRADESTDEGPTSKEVADEVPF